MSLEIIITALIGTVSSAISAWLSWFFTRRKYGAEVDQNIIQNMKESLEFYKQLSDDNKQRLDEMRKENAELKADLKDLQKSVNILMAQVCVNLSCQLRRTRVNLFKEEDNNEVSSRQKMEETGLYNK